MVSSVINEKTVIRVSSVLNRDVKQYGKQHLIDNDDETCWNSDQVIKKNLKNDFFQFVKLKNVLVSRQKQKVHDIINNTSTSGSPQFISVEFSTEIFLEKIALKFQGGFVGKECCLKGQGTNEQNSTDWKHICDFYPKDICSEQIFDVKHTEPIKKVKIIFNTSSDFYGRITVYKLDLLGKTDE